MKEYLRKPSALSVTVSSASPPGSVHAAQEGAGTDLSSAGWDEQRATDIRQR